MYIYQPDAERGGATQSCRAQLVNEATESSVWFPNYV